MWTMFKRCEGVIVSVGGQIPNNLALPLHKRGVRILGTSALMIDNAENRPVFSAICDTLSIRQPEWRSLTKLVRTFTHSLTHLQDMRWACREYCYVEIHYLLRVAQYNPSPG